ncbi:unnamed protein product [Linum tenue]|uniref:GDSL esterase/lipase n=1 Tax=Linum tenue TaxID=586396 RepID=A0AAV0H0K0_9ROSI|nr:unnamed protein product [Linum tenue]
MESPSLTNILCGGVLVVYMLSSSTFLSGAAAANDDETAVPAMFVFGDSLVEVGNNIYIPTSTNRANYPHNGIDFPNHEATGRWCNGKNSADWLAERFGVPSPPPYLSLDTKTASSYMAGASFASAGSLLLNSSLQNPNASIGFADQVGYYETVYQVLTSEMGSAEAKTLLSKSIFVIVIGSNDIFTYQANTASSETQTIPPSDFTNLMADNIKEYVTVSYNSKLDPSSICSFSITQQTAFCQELVDPNNLIELQNPMQALYEHGARKFVVAGAPLLGCTPMVRRKFQTHEACSEPHNSMAATYNQQLQNVLADLETHLPNSSCSYLDTFNILQDLIQNPAPHGFEEVAAACCGIGYLRALIPCFPFSLYCSNRSDHVFWDFVHPTEAAAKLIVDAFFDGLSSHHDNLSLKQMAAT